MPFYENDDDASSLTREESGNHKRNNVFPINQLATKEQVNKDSLIKKFMGLCEKAGKDSKQFAEEHNITSSDLDSVRRGIELLTENSNLEAVAN